MQKTFSAYLLGGVLIGLLAGVIAANVFTLDRLLCSVGGIVAGAAVGAIVGLIKHIIDKKGN